MTEKEKMINGQMYNAADEQLYKDRIKAQNLCYLFNQTSSNELEKRDSILNELLGSYGKDKYIEPSFKCDYGYNISIGDNFYANYDCIILDICKVKIGDNCLIAPRVCIYTATHPIDSKTRYSGLEYGKPITIGNNVWIGGNAVICPGVTIGNNAVIAAGSVVVKDVADNTVVAGIPAKVIKQTN